MRTRYIGINQSEQGLIQGGVMTNLRSEELKCAMINNVCYSDDLNTKIIAV